MFSGIVEALGTVVLLEKEQNNLHISVQTPFARELKIDQSIAHNGACLTVVKKDNRQYTVTAIKETLQKTNLGLLKKGDVLNLERSLKLGDRIDGHMVQGHVDATAVCKQIKKEQGSWLFTFNHKKSADFFTVEKGSICVNGVSLTVVNATLTAFSVAVIPYTFEHTNFNQIKAGSTVNIEFDILGKYISKHLSLKK